MALTSNGLPITAEGLKELKKIARMEWPSKQNYRDDEPLRYFL